MKRTPSRSQSAAATPDLAARLTQRLSRLQQVAAVLLRSLDRREIQLELAAQLAPLLGADRALVADPGGDGEPPVRVAPDEEAGALELEMAAALVEVKATGRVSRAGGTAGRSVLAAPVLVGFRLEGILAVSADRPGAFDERDEELLLTVARLTATALVNATLYTASERERRTSDALAELAAALGASLRPAEVVRLGLRHAMGLLRTEAADLMLRRGEFLHIVAAEGTGRPLEGLYLPITTSLSGRAVTEGRTVVDNVVARTRSAHPLVQAAVEVRQAVVTPLRGRDGPIGAIAVLNREQPFGADDVRDLERLAAQVSVALANARLFEEADAARTELTAAFEAMSGGMAVVDSDGRIVRHNARMLELSGARDPSAIVGRELYEALLHGPPPGDETTTAVGRALGGWAAREALIAAWSGRQLELSAAPHPDGGAVVTVEDVTEAMRARAEAEVANARYRELFETAADVIITVDMDGQITSANRAVQGVLGYDPAVLTGRSMFPLVDPEDSPVLEEAFRECLQGRQSQFEVRVLHRDGGRRLMAITNSPLQRGGRIVGALGIGRDVTTERERASALERAEARFTRLVESAEDAICTVDEEGTLTAVNPAFARVMAMPREQLVGHHFASFLDPIEHEKLWPLFLSTMRGERQRAEVQYVDRSDGLPYVATVVTAPLMDGDRITGGIAVFRDVTEERRLFERMARNDKLAALGELVGGVAHEVNTPLASILAYGQLLQTGRLGADEASAAAATIVSESKRAARLVSKLLGFARPASPERVETDVGAVVRDVLELRRHSMKTRQVSVTVDIADEVSAVWADPFQLQQVFMNLLANAEHAVADLPDGTDRSIRVAVAQDGPMVRVVVEDAGAGIPEMSLPHIFNPFYTTKPRGAGTGLGLSIVDGIVRDHGGSIVARNRPGGGAAFELRLPVQPPAVPTPGSPTPASPTMPPDGTR